MLERIFNPRNITKLMDQFFEAAGIRGTNERIDLHTTKKVLVIKLDGIGDMILASPLLRELRANLPEAFITLVVAPHVLNLVELCPYVDEVLTFAWEAGGRWGHLRRYGRILSFSVQHLWRQRFELALAPYWEADWYGASAIGYFSGAPRRVGYSEQVNEWKKIINKGFDNYYTDALRDPVLRHEVDRHLHLLEYVGFKVKDSSLECWISSEDEISAKRILHVQDRDAEHPVIIFGIGSCNPKNRWPLDNFLEVGAWLIKKCQARILVVGGPQDQAAARELETQLGQAVLNAAGLLTLRQTAAMMKQAAFYLGNDTGPMHLAAANNLPVIEISCHPLKGNPCHARSPQRFGPWGVPHKILQPEKPCAPCSQECLADQAHCILNVSIDAVKAACRKMLKTKAREVLA